MLNQETRQVGIHMFTQFVRLIDDASAKRRFIQKLQTVVPNLNIPTAENVTDDAWVPEAAPKVADYFLKNYKGEGLREAV